VRRGEIVVWRHASQHAMLVADCTQTTAERMRGLLGSKPLLEGQALWITPCNSVHCWFMSYAIDVVYLCRQGRIIKCVECLKPWRISGCFSAASVVELAAGEVVRLGLQVGDEVRWCD